MDWLNHLLLPNGHFLGIEWSVWKVIGWMGNAIFSTRFLVQWYATEKRQQVVVPPLFWWFGPGRLAPPVVLRPVSRSAIRFSFSPTPSPGFPTSRNLLIHRRHERSKLPCPSAGHKSPATANFCGQCGVKLLKDQQPAEGVKS